MMFSKKNPTASALRAAAEAATVKRRELEMIANTKREQEHEFARANPSRGPLVLRRTFFESDLRAAELHRETLEAEEPAECARHAEAEAYDAAEIAEGDELARARAPKLVHDDLAALGAERDELARKLADVDRRLNERLQGAFRADTEHAARRVAAGLPPSPALPRPVPGRTYLAVLAERVERGVPLPSKAAQIESCRLDERKIAIDLEEQRLVREEHEKEIARIRENRAREAEESNRRMEAQAKERREQEDAEKRRREKLAADYQARRAAGGAP